MYFLRWVFNLITAPTEHKSWPTEKMCRQCHVGSHSPLFTVKQYWPKIAH